MRHYKTVVASIAIAIAGGTASAAPVEFDFATLADTIGEATWGTSGVAGGWNQGGIVVMASGDTRSGDTTPGDPLVPDAYLDGSFGEPGGLGVCSTGTSVLLDGRAQCAPSSDDNAGFIAGGTTFADYEVLRLDFSTGVTMTDLFLRDRGHAEFLVGDKIFIYSSTFAGEYEYGVSDLSVWGESTYFEFEMRNPVGCIGGDTSRCEKPFYISSITVNAIPVPAAGLLLLGGLGGLAALRRRKTA